MKLFALVIILGLTHFAQATENKTWTLTGQRINAPSLECVAEDISRRGAGLVVVEDQFRRKTIYGNQRLGFRYIYLKYDVLVNGQKVGTIAAFDQHLRPMHLENFAQ